MKKVSAVLSLLIVTTLNCGDRADLTTREFSKIQSRENSALRLQELKGISGRYIGDPADHQGIYLTREARWVRFELILVVHMVPQEDPENVNTILVPRLGGSHRLWFDTVWLQTDIEAADYDPETKILIVKFKDYEHSMRVQFQDSTTLVGIWNSSFRGSNAIDRVTLKRKDS